MSIRLRPARVSELPALSALCLRSKAHWGYDDAFLAACRDELTVRARDNAIVAEWKGTIAGTAQIHARARDASLESFFVDPPYMSRGVGRALFDWCRRQALLTGAERLLIEADPNAESFYQAMGAVRIGSVPSASIPGRQLPLLEYRLRSPAGPARTGATGHGAGHR